MTPERSFAYAKYKLQKSLKARGLWCTFKACWGIFKACIFRVGRLKVNRIIKLKVGEVIRSVSHRHRRLGGMEQEFDRKHRVKTAGYIRLKDLDVWNRMDFRNNYQATLPSALQTILSNLQIAYEDFIFIDLGSGMGKAILMASEFPFKKIVGVEFSSELHRIAQRNVRNFRSVNQQCQNIELVCMDAVEFPIPPENTVFYLFNPFQRPIMERVLENIRYSLQEHPRQTLIAYHDIGSETYALFEAEPFLQKVRSDEASFVTRDYQRAEPRPFAIYRAKASNARVNAPQ